MYEDLINYHNHQSQIRYLEFKREMLLGDESVNSEELEQVSTELIYLKEKVAKVEKLIDLCDEIDSQILRGRYCQGKKLYEISREISYSYGRVRQSHSQLIKSIQLLDRYIAVTKGEQ